MRGRSNNDSHHVEFQVRFSLQLPSMLLKRGEIQDTKTLNLSRNIVSLQVCVDVFCFSPYVINLSREKKKHLLLVEETSCEK